MLSTGGIIVFVLLTAVAGYFLTMGMAKMYNRVSVGRPVDRSDRMISRIIGSGIGFFGKNDCQRKISREGGAGLMHLPILYGLLLFILGAVHLALEKLIGLNMLTTQLLAPYFFLLFDIGAVLLAFGILFSAVRRYIQKIPRLGVGTWEEEKFIVFLIVDMTIVSLGYVVTTGFKIIANTASYDSYRYSLAVVSQGVASLFSNMSPAQALQMEWIFWWIHIVASLMLIAIPNWSPLMHPAAAPLNIIFRHMDGKIEPLENIDFEDEEAETFGVNKVTDFTWKELLDCYSCAECGRCTDNCPANITKKPLSPKHVLLKIKEHLEESMPGVPVLRLADGHAFFEKPALITFSEEDEERKLLGGVIEDEEIWACTTCRACREQCPNLNEHANKLIELRRAYVLDESDFPAEAQLTFTNMERNSNPWGIGWADRANWAEGLDVKLLSEDNNVEYLYYVGCAGSFDDRIKKVSTSVVKILKDAGISFGILGTEEKCCGDSARRLGNEYLYQTLAQENIETFKGYGVKKIITACPHCFTVMKNDYKQLGGDFELIHHTQLIDHLIKAGKVKPGGLDSSLKVTYHDSCYLGRYHDEYDAPRNIMSSIKGLSLVEMEKNRNTAFCCGAGGGRMWLEEEGERINIHRTEMALVTDPQAIVVNCPFCLTMLEDGLKDKEKSEEVNVYDIAELVAKVN